MASEPTNFVQVAAMCPVCNGAGTVSRPPWVAGDVLSWLGSGTESYPCKACEGKGIVWPHTQPATLTIYNPDAERVKELEAENARLREVAALKHPNDLRERNDRLAANNGALSNRATKAEAALASRDERIAVLEQENAQMTLTIENLTG